ncbi:MAG TPA: hypothetical protein VJ944_04330, partial [Thermoplasmataceae archaeon]|nr:hypothetical protein [Thermoplasmataceae archaeon]
SLAVKFWKLFIEINALPFFILIILYNAHIFYGNFLLQAAFIILAASSPYLLVTASSILSSSATSLMNTGDFLGSSVSGPAGAIGKFASGSVKNSVGDVFGTAGKSGTFASRAKKTSMQDFALARDLEYNRFEVDSYEE